MAITKEVIEDKIEIVGDLKAIQVRTATIIKEDGVEISRSLHRKVLNPIEDITNESNEVKAICNAVWTDDVKDAYKKYLEDSILSNA
tara:strand:- start:459 stop:719 length:261 start_codon:yes stop_codon:yes gene_type:complete